jgi:hypothetical protein
MVKAINGKPVLKHKPAFYPLSSKTSICSEYNNLLITQNSSIVLETMAEYIPSPRDDNLTALAVNEVMFEAVRVPLFATVATEEYLESRLRSICANPVQMCEPQLLHGQDVAANSYGPKLAERYATAGLHPDRAIALSFVYRLGFGVVQSVFTANEKPIAGADVEAIGSKYREWADFVIDGRVQEMEEFLGRPSYVVETDRHRLAANLLEQGQQGTIAYFMTQLHMSLPLGGQDLYPVSAQTEESFKGVLLEGTLGGLFFLREHLVEQELWGDATAKLNTKQRDFPDA